MIQIWCKYSVPGYKYDTNMSVPGYKTRSVLATVTPPLTISGKKYSADQKSTSLCSSFIIDHHHHHTFHHQLSGSSIANKKSKNMERQIQKGFQITKIEGVAEALEGTFGRWTMADDLDVGLCLFLYKVKTEIFLEKCVRHEESWFWPLMSNLKPILLVAENWGTNQRIYSSTWQRWGKSFCDR